MTELARSQRLKKELGLLNVYAIATGTTLSAGFFLLPGLAATYAGPALILAYMIAVVPLLPAMFSIVELATAMPRAGGVYYFLDRTMGPAVGTVGGLGTWLVLILKVSFALIGVGAYLAFFWPEAPMLPIMIGLALVLSVVNMFGSKKTGGFQVAMVIGLLLILVVFVGEGVPAIKMSHFQNFLGAGWSSILSTAGFVYVSYVGITTVVSLSEEVKDPERNLPLGIFLTLGTTVLVYAVGTAVMVGAVPAETLAGDLTPVATAAEAIVGHWGAALVSVAALLAFISVSNAGIMSASRFPLAMSRDHLMPRGIGRLGWHRIPFVSVIVTAGLIILVLVLFDPTKIAKLASAFQLMMFAMVCVAVIVMRESGIESYDPGYRSPWYPWMQILGILTPIYFITQMGWLPMVFTGGLILLGVFWYRFYGRHRARRDGAIYHVFERLGRLRYEGLDRELRGILKEKGLREADPFDEIVARSDVLDISAGIPFETIVARTSEVFARRIPPAAEELRKQFLQGTLIGATPVSHGVALPHLRVKGLTSPEMVLVRARGGVDIHLEDPLSGRKSDQTVRAIFFLVSPDEDPALHLRILAQIAGRVDSEDFAEEWEWARHEPELKEILLRDERFLTVIVDASGATAPLVEHPLRELPIPGGSLIALVKRGGEVIVPRGDTCLRDRDRLTIIGNAEGVEAFRRRFGGGVKSPRPRSVPPPADPPAPSGS